MLTDSLCKSASCPAEKARIRLSDSGNLYLEVTPSGGKYWRWKYTFGGKEKRLALGVYPKVSLANARLDRDRARITLAEGQDPGLVKKLKKQIRVDAKHAPFREVALEWHKTKSPSWSPDHAERQIRLLERDIFPMIGDRPIKEISGNEILHALQKIEDRGAIETADRGLMICRQIYEFVALDGIPDATHGVKQKLKPYRGKKLPAIIEPKRFAQLLHAIDGYRGGISVRTAFKLAPILFQRPANLRQMKWEELDLENGIWTIPSAEMKRTVEGKAQGQPHYVPLPSQAIKLLLDIKPFTGKGTYVFPGERDRTKPISENSISSALMALGFKGEHCWHGFRASGRTMIDEQLGKDSRHLEAQLAHTVKDANGTSYNRTQFLKQRTEILQDWANYLDALRQEYKVQL